MSKIKAVESLLVLVPGRMYGGWPIDRCYDCNRKPAYVYALREPNPGNEKNRGKLIAVCDAHYEDYFRNPREDWSKQWEQIL